MAPHLSAVILAAGFSSRMRGLKPLLPLGSTTVLDHCVQLFQEGGINDVVVVTGHRTAEISGLARCCGARPVYNPDFAAGMFTSIQTGMRALSPRSRGFFLLPVDIPLVRPATIKLLTKAFAATSPLIAYPIFAGKRGHPPLIATELVPDLIVQHHPEGGLRSLLAAIEAHHPAQVRNVAVADAHILFDMDTPDDYMIGSQRLARSGYPSMEECEVILHQLHPMEAKGVAHGRLVAAVAVALCEALRPCRPDLDPELCRACGLLHNIAKGYPDHEQEGGRWLRELGFERAAEIVAAHRDLVWEPGARITEKEIVHLADKLARGNRIVTLGERFEEKLTLYQDNPEAVRAIHRRYELARQIAAAIEAEAGQSLDAILSSHLTACGP